jgi:hypothetical protein
VWRGVPGPQPGRAQLQAAGDPGGPLAQGCHLRAADQLPRGGLRQGPVGAGQEQDCCGPGRVGPARLAPCCPVRAAAPHNGALSPGWAGRHCPLPAARTLTRAPLCGCGCGQQVAARSHTGRPCRQPRERRRARRAPAGWGAWMGQAGPGHCTWPGLQGEGPCSLDGPRLLGCGWGCRLWWGHHV